jgi:hypothetical protein
MKNFLVQLWHDLREKRLWPVAVVLLLALIAIPVALSKTSEEPPAAPPAPAAKAAPSDELKGLASVTLDKGELDTGSTLNTFDPTNPFRPPAKVIRRATQTESSSTPDAGPSSGADAGTPSRDVESGGGGQTDAGGDSSGGDGTQPREQTQQYTYVLDVMFSVNGRTRQVKGMERLGMLPNEANPLLIFLGVTPNAGNAVFLVDSTLHAAGEGKCKPSADDCAYLQIGAGSIHEFTNDDGDSYRLRIDEIRKVEVGDATASAAKRRARTAAAAGASSAARRRFVAPILADLVTVSSGDPDDSNSDSNNR